MATATPDVVLVEPMGWSEGTDIAPPRITASATLTSFRALVAPGGDAVLVRGCVASSIPGWVEDMRPAIEARAIALVGAASEKASGFPIDARPEGDVFALRPAARLDRSRIGVGRPFVGFDDAHVVLCFASCVERGRNESDPTLCESTVAAAHLSPNPPPPPPGILLGAVTWAVHHPRSFTEGAGVLAGVVVLVALLSRPRALPRRSSRIFRAR